MQSYGLKVSRYVAGSNSYSRCGRNQPHRDNEVLTIPDPGHANNGCPVMALTFQSGALSDLVEDEQDQGYANKEAYRSCVKNHSSCLP